MTIKTLLFGFASTAALFVGACSAPTGIGDNQGAQNVANPAQVTCTTQGGNQCTATCPPPPAQCWYDATHTQQANQTCYLEGNPLVDGIHCYYVCPGPNGPVP